MMMKRKMSVVDCVNVLKKTQHHKHHQPVVVVDVVVVASFSLR